MDVSRLLGLPNPENVFAKMKTPFREKKKNSPIAAYTSAEWSARPNRAMIIV